MWLMAILMGLVEGVTEYLPVSSTGHLILVGEILGFEGPPGKVFEIVIQLGAVLAVLWLYRLKFYRVTLGLLRGRQTEWGFAAGIALAFLPAMVLGVMFHETIKTVLFSPVNVCVMLVLGGIAMLAVERWKPAPVHEAFDTLPLKTCFKIGLFQCMALIPGTSRSAATILGAMLLKVDRKAAAEFSFFLAVPTMLAATVYDIYKNRDFLDVHDASLIGVGFLTAFATSLLVIKALVAYIGRHGFAPFAWYRIVLGSGMLVYFLLK